MSLSKDDLEMIAETFRTRANIQSDESLDPKKLRIEGVTILASNQLTKIPSTEVLSHLERAGNEWSAMSVPLRHSPIDDSNFHWVVVYNHNHDPERQNASIMEEIWHIEQAHQLTQVVKLGKTLSREYNADDEHEAYYLASASLLPRDAVKQFLNKFIESGDRPQESDVVQLAKKYGVSKELVEYRIKRLGLWSLYKGRKVERI